MFVVGYAITFFGFRYTTALPAYTEEQLELFFYYCSPNVVMMTIPIFLLAKKVNVKSDTIKRMLANLTICGFGIYMVHYFFTGPSVLLARALNIPFGFTDSCRFCGSIRRILVDRIGYQEDLR